MIYEEMQADIKELLKLVRLDVEYSAAVGHGVLKPDADSNRAHQQRAIRIDELTRKYGAH
jgi:hypothetical protein